MARGRKKRRERLLALGPQPVEISRLDRKGHGVGVRDDRPVHVFGGLPGERISFQPTERRGGKEFGHLVEVQRPSPDRIEPGCPHFGTCGGCSLQHLGPKARMVRAQADLSQLFEAAGVAPRVWAPPLIGEQWGYRRKARLGVKRVEGKGRVLVGFRELDKRFVADLERCPILAPPVGDLLRPLGDLVDATSLARRIPQVEVAVGDETTALILRVLDPPTAEDRASLAAFERAHGVRIYLQSGGPDTVTPLDERSPLLHYRVDDGAPLGFLPTDFVQVHAAMNRRMVRQALEWLDLDLDQTAGDGERQLRVLDLFCGLGNFTLPLARAGARVHGVEGDAGLVARGRDNATAAGLGGVAFEVADLYGALEDVPLSGPAEGGAWDRVLLDPPRSGAEAVVAALAEAACPRIVYVACGPQALARDAAILEQGGYRLARAGVMDLFPQTAHYESMALFERVPGLV